MKSKRAANVDNPATTNTLTTKAAAKIANLNQRRKKMKIEDQDRDWINAPTREELNEANHRLQSLLFAVAAVAAFGWALAFALILK